VGGRSSLESRAEKDKGGKISRARRRDSTNQERNTSEGRPKGTDRKSISPARLFWQISSRGGGGRIVQGARRKWHDDWCSYGKAMLHSEGKALRRETQGKTQEQPLYRIMHSERKGQRRRKRRSRSKETPRAENIFIDQGGGQGVLFRVL